MESATLKPGCSSCEEHVVRADRVQEHEAAGRHEREGEEKDACVRAPLGRLARGEPEPERDPAGEAEDQEVQAVVLDVRVELLAQQQRHEPDERERAGEDTQRDSCLGPCLCA